MDISRFKKICLVGWARSGTALCNVLLSLKKEVRVSEQKESASFDTSVINDFGKKGVQFEFGGHSEKFIKDSQLIILSPGVDPLRSAIAPIVGNLKILCVGEVEFASWLTQARLIAVTGTNGKTTTAYLTHKVLLQKRKRVFLGGNIGTPFSSFVLDTKKGDLVVLEISSFQMETIIEFRPYVAALLNIEPDHLDRYADFQEYFGAKMNIFKNQRRDDWAVINKNIQMRSTIEKNISSSIVYFSNEFENENLSCIYRIASVFGFSKLDCLGVFSSFKGLPHRLEVVREIKGITFVNDSKATNPSSTIWALKNTKTPVILLAGGKDKGLDYASITPYLRRVKKINLFGQAGATIKKALESSGIDSQAFSSFKDTIVASFNEASPGDTVILSPMCSSFDEFKNYEERGKVFCEIVNSL